MIINSIINVAPNKKFYQLHRNKRNKKQVNPWTIKIFDFIVRISIVVQY